MTAASSRTFLGELSAPCQRPRQRLGFTCRGALRSSRWRAIMRRGMDFPRECLAGCRGVFFGTMHRAFDPRAPGGPVVATSDTHVPNVVRCSRAPQPFTASRWLVGRLLEMVSLRSSCLLPQGRGQPSHLTQQL